jgi:poly-gamma-glutamate capsule biosynthesis protein CapA/YwtB (metallophosphatase superfamily)
LKAAVCALVVILLGSLLLMSACAGWPVAAQGAPDTVTAMSATGSSAFEPATTSDLPPTSTSNTTTTLSIEITTTTAPPVETTTTTTLRRITVAIAGDVLTNKPILRAAYRSDSRSYDFDPIFAPITPYLKAADLTVVNLETRLAGPERGYSSFPRFDTPDALAATLKGAGVDVVANANNHALDMGWEGVARTLDVVEGVGLDSIGTYRSQAERDIPYVVDVGGIKLGFLNYTSITNGISVPKDHPYALALLDPAVVVIDAAKAREAGADLVIALLHWGVEYQRRPAEGLQVLGERLLRECGVDAIVAGHPHVVGPIERVGAPGTGTGGKYVMYSVGNLMSSMVDRYSDCGVVAYLQIEKLGSTAWVTGVQYLPVYMQRGASDGRVSYRILPVLPGVDPLSDLPLTARDRAKLDQIWRDTYSMLDDPRAGVTALDRSTLPIR